MVSMLLTITSFWLMIPSELKKWKLSTFWKYFFNVKIYVLQFNGCLPLITYLLYFMWLKVEDILNMENVMWVKEGFFLFILKSDFSTMKLPMVFPLVMQLIHTFFSFWKEKNHFVSKPPLWKLWVCFIRRTREMAQVTEAYARHVLGSKWIPELIWLPQLHQGSLLALGNTGP